MNLLYALITLHSAFLVHSVSIEKQYVVAGKAYRRAVDTLRGFMGPDLLNDVVCNKEISHKLYIFCDAIHRDTFGQKTKDLIENSRSVLSYVQVPGPFMRIKLSSPASTNQDVNSSRLYGVSKVLLPTLQELHATIVTPEAETYITLLLEGLK